MADRPLWAVPQTGDLRRPKPMLLCATARQLRGQAAPLKTIRFPRPVRLCAIILAMLALSAAPAFAGTSNPSWGDNPALSPFQKTLAKKIADAPDPFAQPVQVIRLHVD